jgi:hypothetical protein
MRKTAMESAPAFASLTPATEGKPDRASAEISTDISYLPDLTAYLDDLLRTRERLAAATGIDTWARDKAAPAGQEITVIRQLISRIKGDISGLSPDDRARINEAVAVVRKHRAVSIGMPRHRPAAHALTSQGKGQAS